VLRAKIGDHLIVARKSGDSWFLGGMTGDQAFSGKVALDFLDLGKTYEMTTFCDDSNGFSEGWCPTIKDIKKVNSANYLSVEMLSSGGVVAIFDPVD
jgi:alpha-glucosidase